MQAVEGHPGWFQVVVQLPPGYHQYKYIVDGDWRHDEAAPLMPDPLGNVNNWLYVRRPENVPQGPVLNLSSQLALAAAQHILSSQPNLQNQGAQQQPELNNSSNNAAAAGNNNNNNDIEMEQVVAPAIGIAEKEPDYTKKKIRDFLSQHTAYELIPESGKVVIIDMDFPVRQAFHALYEQGLASAPLWDSREATVVGMVSASDFILALQRLRSSITSRGGNLLSERELDVHTIRSMREAIAVERSQPPKQLVFVKPEDTLQNVVKILFQKRCAMAPILTCDPCGSEEVPDVLHIATHSGVLACLMRHFRASLASLPLLTQTLNDVPLGTWAEDSPPAQAPQEQTLENSYPRKIRQIHTVKPSTPLTTALGMLLEAGVSFLPVVDDKEALVDLYARADISSLVKGNAYNRLQHEDVTVGQALTLTHPGPIPWTQPHGGSAMQGSSQQWQQAANSQSGEHSNRNRLHVCHRTDTLRVAVERLAVPGVRRLIVIDQKSRKVEGIVSLSDITSYLFLSLEDGVLQ